MSVAIFQQFESTRVYSITAVKHNCVLAITFCILVESLYG